MKNKNRSNQKISMLEIVSYNFKNVKKIFLVLICFLSFALTGCAVNDMGAGSSKDTIIAAGGGETPEIPPIMAQVRMTLRVPKYDLIWDGTQWNRVLQVPQTVFREYATQGARWYWTNVTFNNGYSTDPITVWLDTEGGIEGQPCTKFMVRLFKNNRTNILKSDFMELAYDDGSIILGDGANYVNYPSNTLYTGMQVIGYFQTVHGALYIDMYVPLN